jgi:hypothetical protein
MIQVKVRDDPINHDGTIFPKGRRCCLRGYSQKLKTSLDRVSSPANQFRRLWPAINFSGSRQVCKGMG